MIKIQHRQANMQSNIDDMADSSDKYDEYLYDSYSAHSAESVNSAQSADTSRYSDELNIPINKIPNLDAFVIDELVMDYQNNPNDYFIDVETSMTKPLYVLEFIGCICASVLLYSGIFTFTALIFKYDNDMCVGIVQYIGIKLINFITMSMLTFVFITVDTFKSINIVSKFLFINAIIYKFDYKMFTKFILIHISTVIIAAPMSILIFESVISNIPTEQLLNVIFDTHREYTFNVGYMLITVMVHLVIGTGLTLLTQSTRSCNAHVMCIYKLLILFVFSLLFEIIIGPVDYVLSEIILYISIIIWKSNYQHINYNLLISYGISLIIVIILYPLLAFCIKTSWRKKFTKYVEYGKW